MYGVMRLMKAIVMGMTLLDTHVLTGTISRRTVLRMRKRVASNFELNYTLRHYS